MSNKAVGQSDSALTKWTIVMLFIGTMAIFDAGFTRALHQYKDMWHWIRPQLMWVGIGLVAMYVTSRLNYGVWKRYANVLMVLSLALCALVLVPGIGSEMNHARRWFSVGKLNVQPAEFAKLAVLFYLGAFFASQAKRIKNRHRSSSQPGFFEKYPWVTPLIAVIVLMGLIEREPDMGTAIIVGAIALGMICLANVRWPLIIVMVFITGVFGYGMIKLESYRGNRIKVWLNAEKYYEGMGYQIIHGEIAVGSGALWGLGGLGGIGQGRGKRFIPAATTDYIFATIAEETGFLGSILLIIIMLAMVRRCLAVGGSCNDPFGAMVASGVGWWIGSQTLMNLAVVTRSIPPVGVPLPFVSYGGSSLLVLLVGIGVVQSVARHRVGGGEC